MVSPWGCVRAEYPDARCVLGCLTGIVFFGGVNPVPPSALHGVGVAQQRDGGIPLTNSEHPLGVCPGCRKIEAGLQALLVGLCGLNE